MYRASSQLVFAKQNGVSVFLVKVFAKQKSLFIYARSILLVVIEMGELRVEIPEEFEEKIKEFPEIEEMIVDFIRLKIFEHELKNSRELQRFIFESLSAKSKLTLEDAMVLGNKVNEGMLEELKEKGLI